MRLSKKARIALARKNRRKWLKALRSGKYKQTTGHLAERRKTKKERDDLGHVFDKTSCPPNEGTKFCCLGVAAKVCKLLEASVDGGDLGVRSLKLLGLTEENQGDLIRLNDQERKSFKHIAKTIETLPVTV